MFGKGTRLGARISRFFNWAAKAINPNRNIFRKLFGAGMARMGHTEKRLISVSVLVAITSLGLIFTFSNCGRVTFNGESAKSNTGGPITPQGNSCPLPAPANSEQRACPADTSGSQFVTVHRAVDCKADGNWDVGGWDDPDYSSCTCSIEGQVLNPISGICACPTGQDVINGKCDRPAVCRTSTETDTGTCPTEGSTGFSTRTRTITRTLNVTTNICAESVGPWSAWDYTQCQCPYVGQVKFPSTGVCSCPTGQAVVNGTCVATGCTGPKPDPLKVFKICPSGVGQMFAVGPESTCPAGSTRWSDPLPPGPDATWNTSGCGCPVIGQNFNVNDTPPCKCPTGQVVSGGACKRVVCTGDDERTETQACGGGATGNMTRTIPLVCGRDGVEIIPGTPSPWNKEGCVCSGGRTFNTLTDSCACPVGQSFDGTSCVTGSCINRQPVEDQKDCGAGAIGKAKRTRTESCPGSGLSFVYGPWSAYDYEQCTCASDPNAVFAAATGCSCKAGFAIGVSGRCEPVICNWSGDRVKEETDPSLSCGYRKRTESCTNNGTKSATGPWLGRDGAPVAPGGYDYSQCSASCPVRGQVHSRNSASPVDCECPGTTYEVAGTCSTCPNNMIYNLTTKTCFACNPGDVTACVGSDPTGVYEKTCSPQGAWLECRQVGCKPGYQSEWQFEVCTAKGPLENRIESAPGASCAEAKANYRKYLNVNWRYCYQGCEGQVCSPVRPPTLPPAPSAPPVDPCANDPWACQAPGPGPAGPGGGGGGVGSGIGSGNE